MHGQVISEIAQRMGAGMAEFIEREVVTVADYDLYCHYVAGLVGLGLTKVPGHCLLQSFATFRTCYALAFLSSVYSMHEQHA